MRYNPEVQYVQCRLHVSADALSRLPVGHPSTEDNQLVHEVDAFTDMSRTEVRRTAMEVGSGGSWGLGALGPAILWGLLQGCDSTYPRWGSGALQTPPAGSGAETRRQTHFGNNILKLVENQVSWSQSIPIIPIR